MSRTKIQFSPKELALIVNSDWILTKNRIMEKTAAWLEEIKTAYNTVLLTHPAAHAPLINAAGYKISKGENYRGLPWLMLDYPRIFGKEDTMAIRTMFWWGQYFSITLHLSGDWKKKTAANIIQGLDRLQKEEFRLAVGHQQWDHHFEQDNFGSLTGLNREEAIRIITEKPFLKIGKHYPLQEWEQVPEWMAKDFTTLVKLSGI
ncbi:MAG: hypothetical protein GC171_01350 [Terrimonas sp.]|nr:hypothetical protein [Terrimonas sp.]